MGARLVPQRGIATDFYVAFWQYVRAQWEGSDEQWRAKWAAFMAVRNSYANLTYYRESRWKTQIYKDYSEYRDSGKSRVIAGKVTNGRD